jgi:effector-binding domain-containing protein
MYMKIFIFVNLFFLVNLMAIETPKYTVIKEVNSFQIREYTEYVTAEVEVEGSFDEVGKKAFRQLFDYISGNNSNKQKVEMTAPVEQKSQGEKISMTAPVEQKGRDGKYILSFVLPQTLTLETAPIPNDPKVILKNNPVRRLASITYSGFWSESNYLENHARLMGWVAVQKLKIKGEPIYARYNSPFSLWFLRRNEILVEVVTPAN